MLNKKLTQYAILIFMLVGGGQLAIAAQWESLIGDDLSNWETLGGDATYELKEGVIIGTTAVPGSPNTFLSTKKKYSDFILEFEFWGGLEFNSGVMFRAQSKKSYQNGRVHGYQMEIDPSARAFTGGIYDEGRRKWIYPLSLNAGARNAFNRGSWNKFRIEAVGNEIRTWVNGVMASHLIDDLDKKGFIGLQVHRIRKPEQQGLQAKWRDIKILTKNVRSELRRIDPNVRPQSYLVNKLSSWEARNGFRLLWDGKTSQGWRGAKLDGFPKKGWQMKDGILSVLATDGGESTGPGDIITKDRFSDFELELDFKITEGANSGVKYFVDPLINKGPGSAIGLEFQILDDESHPDAKQGTAGNRTLGSLYDLITKDDLSNNVSQVNKVFKGIPYWNRARIVVRDGHVEHWLNNTKIVEFDRYSQIFKALVNYSKYAKWDNFGQLPEGHILLQDHGDTVHYRSIKIREIIQ